MDDSETTKNSKVFSLESYPLCGRSCVHGEVTCHMQIIHGDSIE